MRLCDVLWEDLRVGDILISHLGTAGEIVRLIPKIIATQREDNEIVIKWNNGKISMPWHFECKDITYDTFSNYVLRCSKDYPLSVEN